MRSRSGTRNSRIRRLSSIMAAVGALLVSSGIALMATPTPANAGDTLHKSYVCKYVGTPGTGEVVQAGGNPVFVDNHAIAGDDSAVAVGDLFADAHTFSIVIIANTARLSPEPSAELCAFATASVTPTQPSCANDNTASYVTAGTRVSSWSQSAEPAPGSTVTVTATAQLGSVFSNGLTTKSFTLVFDPATTNCSEPDVVLPQPPTFTDPTCTTAPAVNLPAVPLGGPVTYAVTGSVTAGSAVVVTESLVDPETTVFGEGATQWEHTFTVPTGCTVVEPPTTPPTTAPSTTQVSPPAVESASQSTTPTVVHAGLVGDTATSWGEQGLGLVLAGALVLALVGGLVRGARARTSG
jgi:hypothetical protein